MVAAAVALLLSMVALGQAAAGWIAVRRFARQVSRPGPAGAWPPVTILKPLHGDEPLLEHALATVCQQDYPEWQVVFGVSHAGDTALPVVKRLQARFPACDIATLIDATRHGSNGKVGNLINMLPAAKHDVLVISDSDMQVPPDWLRRVVAALHAPAVGLATTIYTGLPVSSSPPPLAGGGWGEGAVATLGALQINHYFLPGALLARAIGRQDSLGATMALRRETLARIGGFQAVANHLADDNVLGRLVQGLGLKVALADTIPTTTVAETSLAALWRHELRWARTIRALEPAAFAASILQYPIAWAALAILLAGVAPWSLAWFALAWVVRAALARGVDRALGLANRSPLWLLPVRELMSVAVVAASFLGSRVDWRGHTMRAEGFDPR
ncbi:MAG TPA: bacteriohopanetetrol glucosamine biosynthesis glycosyltransferase HpnI [Acetobacteraceae bacterium]|nr:bacteriohopanetetrol glucosamine biosynthesis glycosyltransferase HpnI [Acetobacteraceae bacterium]